MDINLTMKSTSHMICENGIHDSRNHGGILHGPVIIKINNHPSSKHYSATIEAIDEKGREVVQMHPKLMELVHANKKEILLRGIGIDEHGEPQSNYGIALKYMFGIFMGVTLYLYDRNMSIVYCK